MKKISAKELGSLFQEIRKTLEYNQDKEMSGDTSNSRLIPVFRCIALIQGVPGNEGLNEN